MRLTQLAIKIGGAHRYGKQCQPYQVEVVSFLEVPESAIALAESAGASITDGRGRVVHTSWVIGQGRGCRPTGPSG